MKSRSDWSVAQTLPRFPLPWIGLFASLVLALPAHAENNTDYIVNGVVSNVSSFNLPVSSPGTNNSLQIINGGAFNVTGGDLTIGPASGDNHNLVLVSGTGSTLVDTNASFSTIWVGSSGANNQLIVTNGGQATGGRFIIGFLSASNRVTVTGANSVLSARDGLNTINLGWVGGYNQFTVADGGRVIDTVANVGSIAAAAVSNVAVVTGAGSVWSNTSTFNLGMGSAGNQLIISDGGRVDVGADFNSYNGLANNKVLVTGNNSLLSLPNSDIFLSGDNTGMTIANGGTVVNRSAYIGYTSSTNNVVLVTDAGTLWSNTASINMGYPGAAGTKLIVTNGARVTSGTLILGGFAAATSNTMVFVTGSNSIINLTGALTIGSVSASNTLQIVNGARVNNAAANVGAGANASNNFVLVSGPGSVWSNSGSMNLGQNAGGNQLTISDGGRVYAADGAIGGPSASIPDNRAVVTGTDSLFNMVSSLAIGGHNANLLIANGGRVANTSGFIGNGSSTATNISVVVSGAGSQWTNADLNVGYVASGVQLVVTNGGRVDSSSGFISRFNPARSNTVVVTGANSLWNIANDLSIGNDGGGQNQLLISDGGRVKNATGNVGSGLNASNNLIVVSGAGSVWSNTGSLNLGQNAGGNLLTIADGGRVDALDASIGGATATIPNNRVVVTGNNSLFSLPTGSLGMGGHNSGLTVANGGRVVDSIGYVGNGSVTATNVFAEVNGAGSQWTNSTELNVGFVASGVQMIITNGGRVDSARGFISKNTTSSNNIVVVTGNGSLWNIKGGLNDFHVGFSGNGGNRLEISDGGRVNNGIAHIGNGVNASNNLVVVTGSGSVWSNTGTVNLGYGAGGNTMIITNSGRVHAGEMSIGTANVVNDNNRLLVTGNGSLLSLNPAGFGIALGGNNARVTVADGGRIIGSDAYIGNGSATATNVGVIVTGAGSVWTNTGSLNAGYTAAGTSLIITNGGRVDVAQTFVGRIATSTNNTVQVSGPGSFFGHRLMLHVGNTGIGTGSGSVLVDNNGTIESTGLVTGSGGSGTISNRGGIYQFTTASPTITQGTAGSILMTNGTISYRGVVGADINNAAIATISRSGNNGFRLNNSSNSVVPSYTFDSIANTGNPSNYQRLALMNNARWTSPNLTIGTGGGLTGGAGDVVEITQNFTIRRNVNTGGEFDLSSSRVLFSGNTGHTNSITGEDFGHNGIVGSDAGFTAENFAYGRLSLGSASDTICFLCGEIPVAPSNALYVTWLDLLGNTNLVANLHAPSTINIYYLMSEPNNAYLNNGVYQLTDCNGGLGGLLMPAIPEPSSVLLISLTACAILWRKARKA